MWANVKMKLSKRFRKNMEIIEDLQRIVIKTILLLYNMEIVIQKVEIRKQN